LVDATTLITISTVAQTIVISVTLVVFALSFRSQEKAIRESSYQGLIGRYNDLVNAVADKPYLARMIFANSPERKSEVMSNEDAQIFSHLLIAYGIIEEAYVLRAKKWIEEDNWQQWAAFLRSISRHPLFVQMHELTRGTFDPGFENYVRESLLKETGKASPPKSSG
jgi:hypothetical protein